jgi:hypothetical protein
MAKYKGPKEVIAGLDKNLANLEKLKNYELLGSNNPAIRTKIEWGKKRHLDLQGSCTYAELEISSSDCSNTVRPGSGCRLDCVKTGSTCKIIEFKPDSDGAKSEGRAQLDAYRPGLQTWYRRDKASLFSRYPSLAQCENSDKSSIEFDTEVITYEMARDRRSEQGDHRQATLDAAGTRSDAACRNLAVARRAVTSLAGRRAWRTADRSAMTGGIAGAATQRQGTGYPWPKGRSTSIRARVIDVLSSDDTLGIRNREPTGRRQQRVGLRPSGRARRTRTRSPTFEHGAVSRRRARENHGRLARRGVVVLCSAWRRLGGDGQAVILTRRFLNGVQPPGRSPSQRVGARQPRRRELGGVTSGAGVGDVPARGPRRAVGGRARLLAAVEPPVVHDVGDLLCAALGDGGRRAGARDRGAAARAGGLLAPSRCRRCHMASRQ